MCRHKSVVVIVVVLLDDDVGVQDRCWIAAADEERIGGGQLGPLKQAVQWSQAATREHGHVLHL